MFTRKVDISLPWGCSQDRQGERPLFLEEEILAIGGGGIMAVFGAIRYKRKPKLMPDGWADLRTAGQEIFMVEAVTYPAQDNTIASGSLGYVAKATDAYLSAAEIASINTKISTRFPRGFKVASADATTSGTCSVYIAGTDNFGVAVSETLEIVDATTASEVFVFSQYAYSKVTSVRIDNDLVDATSAHAIVHLVFSEALGLTFKGQLVGDILNAFTTVVSTGVKTDALASAVVWGTEATVAAGTPRVKADGTRYTFIPNSYVVGSTYTLWVPCLNDQPENLQVNP
jgi:hypothetical protein